MSRDITKESIRQQIWHYMEKNNIAAFPRPVYHRIPNFRGAEEACDRAGQLAEFKKANVVKVNPDKPQQKIRFLTLEACKTLLVPTPRLRTGLFNKIMPPSRSKEILHTCSTSEGVRNYSIQVGLNSKIQVDLVIIGSVAVSLSGRRIGKGEGYADMEYAMMVTMGAVCRETPIITIVHDCQVLDSIPDELFGEHDVPVDIIVTPTRVIRCEIQFPKPNNIIWSLLTEEKLNQIPVLRMLKKMQNSTIN